LSKLTIRKEQIAVWRRSMWEDFVEQMVAELPFELPERFGKTPENELRSFLEREIGTARRHGFRPLTLARRYLLVVGRVGDLETEANAPWAEPILEDEISTPERRMQELEEWAAEIAPPAVPVRKA